MTGDVDRVTGLLDRVVDRYITVDEDPIPRDNHVVEDAEGVLLVEPRRQRFVEVVRTGSRDRVAAQELQAGRVERDGDDKRVLLGARRKRDRRVDGLFVGEQRQRAEHQAAADDDPFRGLAHLSDRHLIAEDGRVGALVDRGLNDRVGQGDVVASRMCRWNVEEIGRPLLVPTVLAGPHPGCGGECRELHVHVVRGRPMMPIETSEIRVRPGVAAPQVVERSRQQVAEVGRLARGRIVEQALLRVPVLLVEHRGH